MYLCNPILGNVLSMDPFRVYSIPWRGLKDGRHSYVFELDDSFFKLYESSPVKDGKFSVEVELDHRAGLSTLDLSISGQFRSVCDRCLVDIDIPVSGRYQLVVKKGGAPSEDPNLVILPEDAHEIRLADILYDYTCLSLPIVKQIACERMQNPPCDQQVLRHIQKMEDDLSNPVLREALQGLNVKN